MNIKLYEDKELKLLGDMYSPTVDIQVATEPFSYENLLMRNNAKARVVHREKISDNPLN